MELIAIKGKNYKNFIKIGNIVTPKDFELYNIIKTVLSRSEYKPFLQSFNKTISDSYLFNDYFFPVTFWQDVKNQLIKFDPNIYLQNEEILYDNEINREDFDLWVLSLKLPNDILLTDDYKFQLDSVFLGLQNKIGRLDISMSGGKTFISYLYCKYLNDNILKEDSNGDKPKILIVVPKIQLAKQLQNDWKIYDKFNECKLICETIFTGSKKILNADVICGTYQSLSSYDEEYFNIFKVLICDELHTAKAYSIKNEIYGKLKNCEYFFGMTGTTPKYNTLDYLHIISMFGPLLVKVTSSELIAKGLATPIEIKVIKIKYSDENENKFSINLKEKGIVGIDKYLEEKNFFHTNEKRINLIAKLLNNYGKVSLICVATVEYCTILETYLKNACPQYKFAIIHGTIDTDQRDAIIDEMRNSTENYCCIGTYGTMSTGISIKNLEHVYLPDGGKAEERVRQTLGRIMRLWQGKTKAICFDFYDDIPQSSFKNHAIERIKIYKEQKFPFKIIDINI